jgi:hypothetical protein
MKLSELGKTIEQMIAEHGDLEVFDSEFSAVRTITDEVSEDHCFEPDWNMPEKFALILGR